MLYKHPLDAPYPVLHTTYAHVPFGVAADYVLYTRYVAGKHFVKWPKPPYTGAKPVFQNFDFLLYPLHMPAKYPDTSSLAMVQPPG
jgi:hypothetical protein